MKMNIGKFKGKAVIVASFVVLFLCAVLACTVYAVTLDMEFDSPISASVGEDRTVGDGPGSTYSVTVNSTYEGAVDNDECRQYIEIYDDTTKNPVARVLNHAVAALPAENVTPAINVKSNNKVRVESVQVLDANGVDITQSAFGGQARYEYFIESTKSSLFGYFELYNITGNITVNVTYDAPVTNVGSYSGYNMYSTTVVTKGDVGPYIPAFKTDQKYSAVYFNSTTFSNYTDGTYVGSYTSENFGLDTTYGSGIGNSGFTFGNYIVGGNNSKFNISDGGQFTRYCYINQEVRFDNTNYSYIADLKAYYNDTGEDTGWDFSSLIGQKVSCSQGFTYNANSSSPRSITYVVTYKEMPKTVIYAKFSKLQPNTGNRKIRMNAAENGKFTISYGSGTLNNAYTDDTLDFNEGTDPLTYSSYNRIDYGKIAMYNSDSVKFFFDNEQGNSVDFRNFKVYALDVDNNTVGEQIAGEGAADPKVTLTYSPARTSWQSDGWVTISGLSDYDGAIYVTSDVYRYNQHVTFKSNGEHTDSFTITADNDFGRISGAGEGGNDANMNESYTQSASSAGTVHWMYSDTSYTVRSDGDEQLTSVTFKYQKMPNGANETLTFDTKNADGSITITYPSDVYYSHEADKNIISVNFDPITTYEAQVYITNQLGERADYYGLKMIEVTSYDSGGEPANAIFNTNNGVTSSYNQLQTSGCTSTSASNIYTILPGATVKVKNIFKPNISESDALYNFINSRLKFKELKVYYAGSFAHNSAGAATLGDGINVTQEGDYFVFTMPRTLPEGMNGVRIAAVYEDHIRTVNILANDPVDSSTKNRADVSTRGTVTLTGTGDNYFARTAVQDHTQFYNHFNYRPTFYKHDWTPSGNSAAFATTDNCTFTLTATPLSQDGEQIYKVKSVKAYKYDYTSGRAINNKIYDNIYSYTTYNWLTFDGDGNVTSTEIPDVVSNMTVTDETTGETQCTITLPSTLDVGNIVLYVEFVENVEKYAQVKYENTAGTLDFKPTTVFTGDIEDNNANSVTATTGAEFRAAFYKDTDDEPYTLTMTVGNDTTSASSFYYTNLTYTVKSYDESIDYGSFRIFKGQMLNKTTGTGDNSGTIDDVLQSFTFNDLAASEYTTSAAAFVFKLPDTGLKITQKADITYVPLTVKQYIVSADGTVSSATDSFTATVTKYNSGDTGQYATYKYFTKEYTDDYLSLITAEAETYFDASSFTAAGAETQRNMYTPLGSTYGSANMGCYVKADAPEGYMLGYMRGTAVNRQGGGFSASTGYYSARWTYFNTVEAISGSGRTNSTKGYQFYYNNFGMLRGVAPVIEIYYMPQTTVTFTQVMTGSFSNQNTHSTIALSNDGGETYGGYQAYSDPVKYGDSASGKLIHNSSFTLSATDGNYQTGTSRTWIHTVLTNEGAVPKFTVHPNGARYIGSVRAYKVVNGVEEELEVETVSGTGYVNSDTTYKLNTPVAFGDDIHIDITYASEQTLTVQAVMLNGSNQQQSNNIAVTNMQVRVTGSLVDSNNDPVPCFKEENGSFDHSEFVVQNNPVIRSTYSSASFTIKSEYITQSTADSPTAFDYVVAAVELYEGTSTSPVNSGVSPKTITTTDVYGNEVEGKDYSECTVAGLRPNVNTTIKVYFARTSKLKVSVYTIGSDGEIHNGVPHQGNVGAASGAYVTVKGSSSISSIPFVTKATEGNYCTGDFQFGYNPHEREVNALQGSTISVFSMLPGEGNWVVKKVVGNGFTSTGVSSITRINNAGTTFYRTNLNISGSIYPENAYEIKIYISQSKLITTKAVTVSGDNDATLTQPNGTVEVHADDLEEGVTPFTMLYPSVSTTTYINHYTASTGNTSGEAYTTQARCVVGTKLHFTITPNKNFYVKTVEFHQGSADGPILNHFTRNGNQYYISTGTENQYTMSSLDDLYIYVEFKFANTSRIYVDYQISKESYGPQLLELTNYFGNYGTGYISATNYNSLFNGINLMNEVTDGDWDNPNNGSAHGSSGNYFAYTEGNYYKYDVITGSNFRIRTYSKDSMWSTPVEFYVTDNDGNIITTGSASDVDTDISFTASQPKTYIVHARFVQNSRLLFRTIDLNCYDNVRQDGEYVLEDSAYGGHSQATREGEYYDLEDVEITDQYKQHISTVTAKYNYGSQGTDNITSGALYENSSLTGPFGFEGDRESINQRDAFVMGNYNISSWNWKTSRDNVALDGTSISNLKVDTSKMRVPVDTPNLVHSNDDRNTDETLGYPSGWGVVAKLYEIDKDTIINNPGLVRAIENLNPTDLSQLETQNKFRIMASFDLERDTARIYKTLDYQLNSTYEDNMGNPLLSHGAYDEINDYMSKDLNIKLDPQKYYMVVVKYELIHVYTSTDSSSISTYFAALHYHNNDTSFGSPSVGLEHDHDLINFKDVYEAFDNSSNLTARTFDSTNAENGYMDVRIPLYFGRPGENEVVVGNLGENNIYNPWYKQTYYIIESDKPKEELPIVSVSFYDYRSRLSATVDASDPFVVDETCTNSTPGYTCWANYIGDREPQSPSDLISYRVVTDSSGFKHYQYLIPMYRLQTYNPKTQQYENTFGETVLDNTLRIKIRTATVTEPTPPPPTPVPDDESELIVSQYDRVSPGEYTLSKLDTAVIVSQSNSGIIRSPGNSEEWISSVTLPQDTGEATSVLTVKRNNSFTVTVTPREGYVLEKIEYSNHGTYYPPDGVNTYSFYVSQPTQELKIYYAHPILRVTVNNTDDENKAAVDAFDTNTDEDNKVRILNPNEFTKDTNVEYGDEKTLKIIPEEYDIVDPDTGQTVKRKYTVEYISVGGAYNALVPVYDSTKENPQLNEDYIVTKDDETGIYYVKLKTITKDTYVFIQMKGETSIYYSNLEVRHHIKPVGSSEYVNCSDDYWGGNVTVKGVLANVDMPLLDNTSVKTDTLTLLKNEFSVSGAIQKDTKLYLNIVPPIYNKIDNVTLTYGQDSSNGYKNTANGDYKDWYTFSSTAPESGNLVVDIYYSLNLTDYTLIYKYRSRFVNEGDGNYEDGTESSTEPDKQYVKKVSLPDTYFKDGKPIASVLINNAPAIDDLYKGCKWVINDDVVYDTENNTATITAVQEVKMYSVKFFKTENDEEAFDSVTRVPLNSFAKKDGEFIKAAETIKDGEDNEIPFAYWSVQDEDQPIKNDKGEITGYKEVTKCFSRDFNYRVSANYRVVPYYSAEAVNLLTINDPEFTREQYTNEDGTVSYDKLYADFILSYMNRENMILLNESNYQTGLLLEFDKNIKIDKEDNAGDTLTDADKKVFTTDDIIDQQALKNYIKDGTAIDAEQYPDRLLYKYGVNNSSYNNKNRVDKAIRFNNTEAFRHYVFRAYYYVIDDKGNVELSDPVYFYLYDIGNSVQNTEG